MNSRVLLLLLALVPSLAGANITCAFTSTPAMAFGAYDDSSAAVTDATTSIVVQCTHIGGGGTNVNVTLQVGPSATSGTIASRQMASGANRLNYNLYRDSARSQVWGQTKGTDTTTLTISGIPNLGSKSGTFVIYGRVPALQNVGIGAYSDSVQLTVSP